MVQTRRYAILRTSEPLSNMDQGDLVTRLNQFDSYLERKMEEERKICNAFPAKGAVLANQRLSTYSWVQEELYRTFPEINPKKD